MDISPAISYLADAWYEAEAIVESFSRLLDPRNTERAFGPPGTPGDPALIEHIGTRLVGIYEALLDWAADLRSITVSGELKNIFELAARAMDRPLEDINRFIDRFTIEVERLPQVAPAADGQRIIIDMPLEITMDKRIATSIDKEMKRAMRKLGL